LGVLEDTPGHYSGDPNYRSVRVVFFKDGDNWKAFPNDCGDQKCLYSVAAQFPEAVKWTIAFDGRNIGQVTTSNPDHFEFYGDIGQQKIRSTESIPTISKPSQKFAGFLGGSVSRPLVAISKPYFRDPEQWKPAQLASEMVKVLRSEFRKKFPKVSNCDNPEANNEKPWPYQDDNIKIIKAYSSSANWSVAQLRLEDYRCDGPSDDAFLDQWFSISPAREIRFLDKAMWLVDAGDYDNDGESEIVFSVNDYDRGGYRLFYDHFRKQAAFEFSYH